MAATKRRQETPRAKLIADLAEAVRTAALTGDVEAMKVATRALEGLVGEPAGDVAPVIDLASRKRGRS